MYLAGGGIAVPRVKGKVHWFFECMIVDSIRFDFFIQYR